MRREMCPHESAWAGGVDAWVLYEQGEFGYKWRDKKVRASCRSSSLAPAYRTDAEGIRRVWFVVICL